MGRESTQFTAGNEGRPKGAKNKATIVKELVANNLWEVVSDKMAGEGIQKYWDELMQLEGRDYLWGYNQLLEYFKPKLNRTTLEGGDNAITVKQIFKIGDKEFEL